MKKAVLLLGLPLAACQTAAPPPAPQAPIDQRIAAVSQDLAKNCAALSTGIVLAQVFNKSERMRPILRAAKVTQENFCAAPPANTAEAIKLVEQTVKDIATALQETP